MFDLDTRSPEAPRYRSENQELCTTKASQIGTYEPIFVTTRLERRPAANGPHLLLTQSRQDTTALRQTNVELPQILTCEEKRRKLNTWMREALSDGSIMSVA
ncbi:hypothetical protein E2C01_041113 [Portunus trituberculatus]|uniref:Uncharacterized protein n=1 Tax=Portunus trituberculatus TaxID=210409 RepID=A0A5B7FQ25_PORTR|nr:hypothetical protein [Portunus trituberculatus]